MMRIAYVYNSPSSFVRQDLDLLSRHFDVEPVKYASLGDLPKVAASVRRSDLSYSWFAGGHAFLAVLFSRLMGKKSIVVAGGYDVASVPEISYGQYTQRWHKRRYTDFALKNADAVLAVSEFTARETLKRTRPRRLDMIYNGVDLEKFGPSGKILKEDLAITVSGINWSNIKRKGIETFVRSATMAPEARFAVIGRPMDDSIDYLRSIAPGNVEFTGFVTDEELIEWYQRARVYVQVSAYESFGLSLAEAMLCDCTPVVTDRGALPEVVGDTGFCVPYGDAGATAAAIKEAMISDRGRGARERVKRLFSLQRREEGLARLIRELHGE